MKVLTLIIKQKYYDKILAGTKKQEFREIKPSTEGRYVTYKDVKGTPYKRNVDIPYEVEIEVIPIKYDAIQLWVGYNPNRPGALVEVIDTTIEYLTDPPGGFMVFRLGGKVYFNALMVYHLGKVIDVTNGKK